MKPYGRGIKTRDGTGCCPGHDFPRIHRWSGRYSSRNSHHTDSIYTRIQNRLRRRIEKLMMKKETEEGE